MSQSTNATKNLMTTGSVWKKIVLFAVPLMLGNFFQQLYNTADSLIVGNFVGSTALAAVSTAGNLIFLLIGFFQGLSSGAGVVIARYLGAKDKENTELAVHTTVAVGLIASILMTAVGILATPLILRLMGTPVEVMPDSVMYFRVYFAGATGIVMYNTLVGILQASGDSKHPLYFLITSSIVNVILDLVFIVALHMGVFGAGLATSISQIISALLCLRQLLISDGDFRLDLRKIKIHRPTLGKILYNGLPSAFQNSIIGFANVVVQSGVNSFGQIAMSGIGAYNKVEGFAFIPITSFCLAITTFVSQNLGASQGKRAKKGAMFGIICSCLIAEIIGAVIFAFAPHMIAAFDRTPEVIAIGTQKARVTAFLFCFLAYSHAQASVMRGVGKAVIPMVVMLVFWCIIRVFILEMGIMLTHSIYMVYIVHPLTWLMSTVAFTICFLRLDWQRA